MDDKSKKNARGQTFPCPKCGGELKWDPAHREVRRPHCSSLIAVPAKEDFEARERDLTAFNTSYLSGFGVLSADMPLKQVYLIAKADMEACQRKRCSGDVPGDTQRDLRVNTTFSEQTFKHLLCPLWVGSFKYKGNVFPFVVNGQTGKLYGRKPWSRIKISAALLLCAFLLFLFYWFFLRGA